MNRTSLILATLLCPVLLAAQNTIAFQGFEPGGGCPDWGYSGGELNSSMIETGTRSVRIGNPAGGTTLTMDPVVVTGYTGVSLSLSHAVMCGSGPGLDWGDDSGREGAVVQVRYNGGAWTVVNRMNGGGDHCYGWGAVGGNSGMGCGYTMPNPLVVAVPDGTNSVQVRVFSTNQNACPNNTANLYSRTDEAFYIDNVRLTTTSPVVTPATGNTTWKGTQSTDWFDCRNWDPPVVPGPGWNVTIDQTATNHCVIGTTTGVPTTAYCANLYLATNGALRRLTVQNSRTLTANGNVLIQRTAATTDSLVMLLQPGSLTCNDLTVIGTNATFRSNGASNAVQVNGNFTLSTGTRGNINNSTIGIGGDLSNLTSVSNFRRVGAWVVLNGSGPQTVTTSGFTDNYTRLRIDKPAGDVTLTAPVQIAPAGSIMQFISGRVFLTGTGALTFAAGTSTTGASNASFVHGAVRKQGNTAFEFPVGKGHVWRPIATTGANFGSAVPTNEFTAEYFNADPTVVFGDVIGTGLDHVSRCEYWRLDRTGSVVTTPEVRITWADPVSCGVDLPLNLRAAHWAGGQWNDRGMDDFIDNGTSGSLVANGPQTAFGFFTLSSTTAYNPLPVELLYFNAEARTSTVDLRWGTATERENEAFFVERSADNIRFHTVAEVAGAGSSIAMLSYSAEDLQPLTGWSYYRLRQRDFDGAEALSRVVPVYFNGATSTSVRVVDDVLWVGHGSGNGTYAVYDMGGRVVLRGAMTADNFMVPIGGLAQGIHVLQLESATGGERVRFHH